MTRFDPIANQHAAVIAEELREAAEVAARILDRVPSREASHALTLLEGAVMFGTRALVKAPVILDRQTAPMVMPSTARG